MKKLLSAILSALAIGGMATAAAAFEKGVDYIVVEETIPEHYVAYPDTYPASPAHGWPECTSGEILKGTVITGIDRMGNHCWKNILSNNASAAFDGTFGAIFDPFEASRASWVGVILDQAYELTEVRFNVRDGAFNRMNGAAIQASQDGDRWITIFLFKEDAKSTDYHIVSPEPITDQAYLDAGYVDYSQYWLRTGAYKMYRFVNMNGAHGEIVELELYGVPGEPSEMPENKLIMYSGECGDNLTWELYDDGEMAIKGEGPMMDFDLETPWAEYINDIAEVTIADGVTSVGAGAFQSYTKITKVTFGSDVTHIGDFAFVGCSKLGSINFSESVTSIGASAFAECSKLESITLPENLITIGEAAFTGCTSLSQVTIPESVGLIDVWAFDSCSALTKATILSRDAEIGFDAFYGTSKKFTLYGYSDSTAEGYAAEFEHKFAALDLPPETEAPFTGPEGTVNLAEVGTIITSSANDVSAAFDGSISTGLTLGGAGSGSWIGVKLEQPSVLSLVRLATFDTNGDGYTDSPHRIFKTVVEGSNDGETWEPIMYFGDPYYEYEDFAAAHEEGNDYWMEEAFDGETDEDDDAADPVEYMYYRVWNDDGNDFWGEVEFWGTLVGGDTPDSTIGDIDGDGSVNISDAIALFRFAMMPTMYPINYAGDPDFTKNGSTDIDDVILLFRHSMMPELYPLF